MKTRESMLGGDLVLPQFVMQEAVWELYEQNFRLELLALDRCIVPRVDLAVTEQIAREEMVANVFPDARIIMHQLPPKDVGLGAVAWERRTEYVDNFRILLALWPNSPSSALQPLASSSRQVLESHLLATEKCLYDFYCQTFFIYFGRAPTVPAARPHF